MDTGLSPSAPESAPVPPLVEKVVTGICRLVDGNGARAEDLMLRHHELTSRSIFLKLAVSIGWSWEADSVAGRDSPPGSRLLADHASVEAAMRADCNASAQDLRMAEGFAAEIRGDPAQAFRTTKAEWRLRDLPQRYHVHKQCSSCRGDGQLRCGCLGGKVRCRRCEGTGKSICGICQGTKTRTVNVTVQYTGGQVGSENRSVPCSLCRGTGRHYSCPGCISGLAQCPRCDGEAWIRCSACSATGVLTDRYWTWLTGAATRAVAFGQNDPNGFKVALAATSLTSIPGTQAKVTKADIAARSGGWTVSLACAIDHVRADMSCLDTAIQVDAIGRDALIPKMPEFLDLLLQPVEAAIRTASSSAEALRAALGSRLTKSVLEAAGAGRPPDSSSLVTTYRGAVSAGFVSELRALIDTAYDRAGAAKVRQVWFVGGPLALLAAALAALYAPSFGLLRSGDGNPELEPSVPMLIDAAVVALPLLATWLAARRAGRKAVRGIVGVQALRRTRQGLIGRGFAVLAVGLNAALFFAGVSAATLGLPGGHAIEEHLRPLLRPPPPMQPTAAAVQQPVEGFGPLSGPKVTAVPDPPEAEMTGMPSVWRMQFHLRQLGLINSPPDGNPVSNSVKLGLKAFMAQLPGSVPAGAGREDATLEQALRDEIHLTTLPGDALFLYGMSNIARGLVGDYEINAVRPFFSYAAERPGVEQSWRHDDRWLKVVAYKSAGSGGNECARFYVRVGSKTGSEQAGPVRGCRIRGVWMPVDAPNAKAIH